LGKKGNEITLPISQTFDFSNQDYQQFVVGNCQISERAAYHIAGHPYVRPRQSRAEVLFRDEQTQ
jgi:hypothetical protein